MVRCRAGFDTDQARLERPKIGDHAAPPQPPANDNLSIGVDTVDLEPVFREIQTDRGNLHGGRLLSLWRSQTTTLWHIDAGSGGRPPHQAHQTPRWSRIDSNVQFRCRLATVRGFVRVGAIYRRTVIRAVASLGEPIELSDGVRGARTHHLDQAMSHQGR